MKHVFVAIEYKCQGWSRLFGVTTNFRFADFYHDVDTPSSACAPHADRTGPVGCLKDELNMLMGMGLLNSSCEPQLARSQCGNDLRR